MSVIRCPGYFFSSTKYLGSTLLLLIHEVRRGALLHLLAGRGGPLLGEVEGVVQALPQVPRVVGAHAGADDEAADQGDPHACLSWKEITLKSSGWRLAKLVSSQGCLS